MKPEIRSAIAYIAGRSVNGNNASAVYDYDKGKYLMMSGDVSDKAINVYDYDSHCHIAGSRSGAQASLYHYGVGKFIQLIVQGNNFNGYDYDSGCHFQGNVSGNSVSFYDFEDGRFHNFSV